MDTVLDHPKLDAAIAAVREGRQGEGEGLFRELLEELPDHPLVLNNLGVLLLARGDNMGAEALLRRAIDKDPGNPDGLRNLALALLRQNRTRRAREAVAKAIAIAPRHVETRYLAAVLARGSGNDAEAMEHLRIVLEVAPDTTAALMDFGAVNANHGRFEEAGRAFERLLELSPENADAWGNLGNLRLLEARLDDAMVAFERALVHAPRHAEGAKGVVICLRRLGAPEEAVKRAEAHLDQIPLSPEMENVLGSALRECGRYEEARLHYEKAQALAPTLASAVVNVGILDLLEGRWEEGWQGYESRWADPSYRMPRRAFAQPRWDGSALEGRTLLLFAEQGIGDALQFVRYAAPVARGKGARIVLECQPLLASLVRRIPEVAEVVPQGAPLPPFDAWLPLASLPLVLGGRPDEIPASVPYLEPGPCPEPLTRPLDEAPGRRIGLVWRGNPEHTEDWKRSLALSQLGPLTSLPDITWVSLQLGRREDEPLPPGAIDAAPHLGDYAATAGVIGRLDAVVTVDTGAAHLAGALGKPCHLLLPFVPDWRWLTSGETTHWYPTLKLHRQPALRDWPSVIARLAEELANDPRSG